MNKLLRATAILALIHATPWISSCQNREAPAAEQQIGVKKVVQPGDIIQIKQHKGDDSSSHKNQVPQFKSPCIIHYRVRPGDDINAIAKRSNTTVRQIIKDSNLKGNVIQPGQVIKIRYTQSRRTPVQGDAKQNH